VAERGVSGVLSFAGVVVAWLSFAGEETMTVRVVVLLRPELSETTYSIVCVQFA
jgi:hypothetical protein